MGRDAGADARGCTRGIDAEIEKDAQSTGRGPSYDGERDSETDQAASQRAASPGARDLLRLGAWHDGKTKEHATGRAPALTIRRVDLPAGTADPDIARQLRRREAVAAQALGRSSAR